jgi:hypothetical protein
MKRKPDQLLNDVFGENSPVTWRGAMLGETLRLVRRRRRVRQIRHVAEVLVVGGLLAVLLRQTFVNPPAIPLIAKKIAPLNYEIVHTRPAPENIVVNTGSLPGVQAVTSASTIRETSTTHGGLRPINDGELLALTATHPVVLIRTGPTSEELVFINPEDQKGFPAP